MSTSKKTSVRSALSRRPDVSRWLREHLLGGTSKQALAVNAKPARNAEPAARKRGSQRRLLGVLLIGAVLNAAGIVQVRAEPPLTVGNAAAGPNISFSLEDLANIEVVAGIKIGDLGDYAPMALRLLKLGLSRHALLKAILDEVTAEMKRRDEKADKAEAKRRHLELVSLIDRLDDALADEAERLAGKIDELKADNGELKRQLAEAHAALKRVEGLIIELRKKGIPIPRPDRPAGGRMSLGAGNVAPARPRQREDRRPEPASPSFQPFYQEASDGGRWTSAP